MKISRLLAILTILLNKDKVTAAELANRFEVSVRTIIRDMQTIGEAGLPIISYQGYDGGYGLVEGYKIDRQLMNPEEMGMAISVLRGMESALGNQSIRSLIDKFEGLSDSDKSSDRLQVDLTPWGISGIEKDKITRLNRAIQHCQVVEIEYFDRGGQVSCRSVEPLVLGLKLSVWYLYAWCRERNDFRLFKLTRMKRLTQTQETFERRLFDSEQLFRDGSDQPIVHLELLFDASAYNRVFDFFESDQVTMLPDGSMQVDVNYPEDEWVYATLLGFGPQVTIQSPLRVRDIIIGRAREMVEKAEKNAAALRADDGKEDIH